MQNGTEPIHVAAAHGHEGIIRALVDKYGVSPITVATVSTCVVKGRKPLDCIVDIFGVSHSE